MAFRLAAQIGCTVDELLSRMSNAEFNEWCAFYRIEPFGYEIESWRAGMIGSTIANVNRPPKQRAFRIDEFMPKVKQAQSAEYLLAAFKLRLPSKG